MKRALLFALLIGVALAQDSAKPEPAKPDPKDAEIAYLKRKIELLERGYFSCQEQILDAAAKGGK